MCAFFIDRDKWPVIAFPNVYWIYMMDVCVCVWCVWVVCVCVCVCVCGVCVGVCVCGCVCVCGVCVRVCICVYYKLTIFWFMGSIDTKAALKLHFHSAYQYMCQVSHQWTLVLNSSNFSICCNDSSLMIALWWETQVIPPVAPLLFIVFLWILLYSSWSVTGLW